MIGDFICVAYLPTYLLYFDDDSNNNNNDREKLIRVFAFFVAQARSIHKIIS